MSLFTHLPEDFLHYVWRTRSFRQQVMKCCTGESLRIIHPGIWNHNQGPDFLHAQLEMDQLSWSGHVELHHHTQDWYKHGHHMDAAYNNTVLHVVLISSGKPVFRFDGTPIPEIELKGRIAPSLIRQYQQLQLSQETIPCAGMIAKMPAIHMRSWLDRLAAERLESRINRMKEHLKGSHQDWEQLVWEEIAARLGGPVNQDIFRQLCKRMPIRILKKYHGYPNKMEALLYGSSGWLSASYPEDDYFNSLKEEWQFLRAKHQISRERPLLFKFMRMRPASFPGIRISQLTMLVHHFEGLIKLLEPEAVDRLLKAEIRSTDYWRNHYKLGQPASKSNPKTLGQSQKHILITNAIIPLIWIYAEAHGHPEPACLASDGLRLLPTEKNKIIKLFESLGICPKDAWDSQALIQLKKHYCNEKKCLNCQIGHFILKQKSP